MTLRAADKQAEYDAANRDFAAAFDRYRAAEQELARTHAEWNTARARVVRAFHALANGESAVGSKEG